MLEKPDIPKHHICECVKNEYGLQVERLTFLPIGADLNTAIYRFDASDGLPYFLKLRSGPFDEIGAQLSRFYSDQGIGSVIPPILNKEGKLLGRLASYKTLLYPFINGRDAYEVRLSEEQFEAFGKALKQLHSVEIPNELKEKIPREDFSDKWRDKVNAFLQMIENETFSDPIAAQLAHFLKDHKREVQDLIERAGRLAEKLQKEEFELIVCDSDLHAGNLHLTKEGTLYIVDFDEPILAPKERDLMYIGGSLLASSRSPKQEEMLFYRGYGEVNLNQDALAYFRYNRIIVDIAEYCEQLLLSSDGNEDRAQSLAYLKANFIPGGTIATAKKLDPNP